MLNRLLGLDLKQARVCSLVMNVLSFLLGLVLL